MWRNEALDLSVLEELKSKADVFARKRGLSYYVLFSKSGFSKSIIEAALRDSTLILVSLDMLMEDI